MENFVLYEEVGRGEHSVVYKGRRKETINFVAIHCIDKCKRPEITNLVRLTHEIQHENIVKFHEWYETSNHLWLVVELCTGGSLETVISQDDHLPESSVRKFGIDLVKGLHHIHSLGIIYSDLKPSKVLLDGPGILKYADFGLSRVEGENLDQVFDQFQDQAEQWDEEKSDTETDDVPKKYKTLGSPTYMAPEVLQGTEHSMLSDIWSLGCILHEMFTGHPPFTADSFQKLADKIINKDLVPPKVKGARVTGKASPELLNLFEGMFQKNPENRMGWAGLVSHPFWQGALQHLAKDLETDADIVSMRESVHQSIANFSVRASAASDLPKGNSVLGQVHGVHIDTNRDESVLDQTLGDRSESTMSMRPRTAPGHADTNVAFTISSRPHTAATPEPHDDHLTSTMTTQRGFISQSPLNAKEIIRKVRQLEAEDETSHLAKLIYHTSDFSLSPIVDNPKIAKPTLMKFDPKSLPVQPHTAEKLLSLSAKDVEKHISALLENISVSEKTSAQQKRSSLLHYTATLGGSNSTIANLLTRKGALELLAKLVKDSPQVEVRAKLCRVIGVIAQNSNEVEESTNLAEVISILTEIIRDNFRNSKMKAAILPGLGEVLHLIASQEEIKGSPRDAWAVPPMTYTMISRCLREGEDCVINHMAAKTIENVATTAGLHSQKLATMETGLLLWYVYSHATGDALRTTALSALGRLSKHNISVFHSVIEKVGLPHMLKALTLPITRVQQVVITMFAALITSDARLTRLIQDKDFLLQIMRLLESPSVVIRAKAFLVILEVIKNNRELLLTCCQNRTIAFESTTHQKESIRCARRLVMYIERDCRRQVPGKADTPSQMDYLVQCMELLISILVQIVPEITQEILMSLDNISGRKHPSTIQVKALKVSLPMMPIVQHFITSQIFRPRIVDESFMKSVGQLLHHVKAIDSGSTQIQAATGVQGTQEFVHSIFAVVEAIAQHPTLLETHYRLVIEKILPPLARLISSSSSDSRSLALRLFSEMASTYLNQEQFDVVQHKGEFKKLHQIISEFLLPNYEQILLEQDPGPSYALKLLLALLEQNPYFIKDINRHGLVPVIFQVLMDHQNNPVSMTIQQICGILNVLVTHKDTNMKELYEQGLVNQLSSLFLMVCNLCLQQDNMDLKAPQTILMSLVDTLHGVLKHVSDVVRKALQAKKAGGDVGSKEAEQAENLLLLNKPFTDLTTHLTRLLPHEDTDLSDIALKALSLLVQLFGGEHPDSMSPSNMECYSLALKKADAKKQKIMLRIIKRMISTERVHCDMMRQNGELLANTIKTLVHTASSHAEVALTTLAAEILKATGYMT